jgi:hypothetical protein
MELGQDVQSFCPFPNLITSSPIANSQGQSNNSKHRIEFYLEATTIMMIPVAVVRTPCPGELMTGGHQLFAVLLLLRNY